MKQYKNVIKEDNANWLQIPDHPYTVLTLEGSGSWKTIALLNLSHQPDIGKIYLYANNYYEPKHQLLVTSVKWS